jgi:hypothetical protein
MGELLVEIFKELTTNDTDEAEFVDSEVKTSFPWMADVDLASREAVTKAIRERFTRRVDADLRSEGEIFADQLIAGIGMLAMERLFPHPKEGRVFGEMMIHLFKWLNQEESN